MLFCDRLINIPGFHIKRLIDEVDMHPFLILIIFSCILLATILIAISDHFKKRQVLLPLPNISCIIPAYNDADTVEQTITSLCSAYGRKKLQIIVVDDASKDNTQEVLKSLQKKFNLQVITNKINLGKAGASNKAVKYAKYNLILFLDADTRINKAVLQDLFARISLPKVGAVSSRYHITNNGILPSMTCLEYAMASIGQAAYNYTSAILLWGGCMLFRKQALKDIGSFKENMLSEDVDAALTLNEKGWKVEQSFVPIDTAFPTKIASIKHKIRVASGNMQCFLAHPVTIITNPVTLIYLPIFFTLFVVFLYSFLFSDFPRFVNLVTALSYSILALPYVIVDITRAKIYRLLFIFPFTFLYYPFLVVISTIGAGIGVYKYFRLRKGGRAW